jgi:hypothetical protein
MARFLLLLVLLAQALFVQAQGAGPAPASVAPAGAAPAGAAAAVVAPAPAEEARAVMERFLAAFNARDAGAWADTLQFPHVRLASGAVTTYETREAFLAAIDLDAFASGENWGHSTWDRMEVVQQGEDKVHIAVVFTRHRPDGAAYASFESLYVIERVDGRWGVRARSSFAP